MSDIGNDEKRPDLIDQIVSNSIDELFHRSLTLRTSEKFIEMMNFVTKFKDYSPFNNALVYLQNPKVTFYATARDWQRRFDKAIKADARPMVILAPKTPVLMVYDLADTEGGRLPEMFVEPFQTEGKLPVGMMGTTLENCGRRDLIRVVWKEKSLLNAGCAIASHFGKTGQDLTEKMTIEIKTGMSLESSYATLCHELAHIYLGHLGSDKDQWWPDRRGLGRQLNELEAEAVSFGVCKLLGITTKSAEYLSGYIKDVDQITGISPDRIMKTIKVIGDMGQSELPDRRSRGEREDEEIPRPVVHNELPQRLSVLERFRENLARGYVPQPRNPNLLPNGLQR